MYLHTLRQIPVTFSSILPFLPLTFPRAWSFERALLFQALDYIFLGNIACIYLRESCSRPDTLFFEFIEWPLSANSFKIMSTLSSPASASLCSDNQLPLPPTLLSRKSGTRNFSYPFSLTEKTTLALKTSPSLETVRDSFATPPNKSRPTVIENVASSQSPSSATQIYGG